MKKSPSLSLKSLPEAFSALTELAGRYALILFLLLLVATYGFMLLRINSYSSAQPTDSEVAAQVKASDTPHLSPVLVQQLQSLQDHSVSVKALFDEARNSPFQE